MTIAKILRLADAHKRDTRLGQPARAANFMVESQRLLA
jgi:hypothetical protein